MWRAVVVLAPLLWAAGCRAQGDPCCPGGNVFVKSRNQCVNETAEGDNRPQLNCSGEGEFLMDPLADPRDAFNVTDEGHLVSQEMEDIIAPNSRFCLTRLQLADGSLSPETVALVCFGQPVPEPDGAHYFTYAVCLCVSVCFLLATLIVYWALPQLRDLQGKTVMCAVASLCTGEAWIAVVQLHESGFANQTTCVVLAFFMYFWMMSAFFWMNIVCFNLWRSVIFPAPHMDEGKLFMYYCFYGWGVPMVFLSAMLITELVPGDHIKPNFGRSKCWFHEPLATWSYFYGPMAVLITLNTIFFLWTSWRLWTDYRNTAMPKLRAMRFKCLLYMKLFVIMGISWIFELLSFMFDGNSGFWVIMDIVNTLHGILIFVVVVLRKRVLQALVKHRPCGLRCPKDWAEGVDEESETMLAEEMQLGGNNPN